MVNSYDEFVKEVRDRIFFLARQSNTLGRDDFFMRVVVSGDPQFLTRYELWQRTDAEPIRLIPTEGVTDAITDREDFLEQIGQTTEMMREETGSNPSGGNPNGNQAEARNPLDFSGLEYIVRYFVDDETGRQLEDTEFRAEKEQEIEQAIRFSGPLSSRPRVALGPAGNLLGVHVEIGNATLDSGEGPGSKGDLDAALDQALGDAVDGDREQAKRVFGDRPIWSVRCR